MDGTGKEENTPQETGQASPENQGTSDGGEKTYTESEVQKLISDGKAALGREKATLANEKQALAEQVKALTQKIDNAELERIRDDPDQVKAYQEKKSQLYEDIVICQDEVNELKTQRSQIHKKIKFSELEEDEKFKAVYNQRKHFIDTIKLTTYRGETSLANTIKQFMAKPAEARSLLRQIFSSIAKLS